MKKSRVFTIDLLNRRVTHNSTGAVMVFDDERVGTVIVRPRGVSNEIGDQILRSMAEAWDEALGIDPD